MSCAHGICGSDGMTINGVASLACQKLVKDFDYTKEIVIEPLQFFPVIKDLIVDMAPFFDREKAVHPPHGINMKSSEEDKEHAQTIEEREQIEEDIKCIMCACCVAVCPVNLREDPQYIGPAAIVRAHRYIFDSRVKDALERMRIMDKPHGIWSCKTYWKCTEVCPKRIPVTKHILETKRKTLQELHPKTKKTSAHKN
jgi:succinate dehydrogenase / fumarate reductase iron-sulfur subunit